MPALKQVLLATALLLGAALSQTSPASAQEQSVQIQVTANDYAARSPHSRIHTTGVFRPDGNHDSARTFETDNSGNPVQVTRSSGLQSLAGASSASSAVPPFTGPGFYPADVAKVTPTGAVITQAQFHDVYINCTGESGAPGETRTPDPLVRSQMLYPTELRAHAYIVYYQ